MKAADHCVPQPPQDWLLPPPRQTRQSHKSWLDDWAKKTEHASPRGGQPSRGGRILDWPTLGLRWSQILSRLKCTLWNLGSKDSHTQTSLCYHYINTDHYDYCLQAGLHFSTDGEWFGNSFPVSLHWIKSLLYRHSNFDVKVRNIETQATLSTWLWICWRHAHDNLQLLLSDDLEKGLGQWYNPNNLKG